MAAMRPYVLNLSAFPPVLGEGRKSNLTEQEISMITQATKKKDAAPQHSRTR
jgi:hypothetical protein